MSHISRPLLIALVAVVALFGVWMVALRPHSSSTSTPAAQAATPARPAAPAQPVKPHPAKPARPVAKPHPHAVAALTIIAHHHVRHALRASRPATSAGGRLAAVEQAMASGKVLALLFYNPSAADDQAVKQELATVPVHGGRVFKLAIPLGELSGYTAVTSQVPVNISPTLVIIDRAHSAQEIAGFADSFELTQRVQDALSTRVS